MNPTPIININMTKEMTPMLNHLAAIIKSRLALELTQEIFIVPVFNLENNNSHLASYIKSRNLGNEDILLLLLTLIPQLEPRF